MDGLTPSKIDSRYSEHKVLFSICDCSTGKNSSFYNITRIQAEEFLGRLKHIEKLEWRQLAALPRESGITVERPDSDSFNMINEQNSSLEKLTEQYYFHFRVEQKGKFRIFGYQRGQLFCITHIDADGRVHHD
jgi:hypothetical protein